MLNPVRQTRVCDTTFAISVWTEAELEFVSAAVGVEGWTVDDGSLATPCLIEFLVEVLHPPYQLVLAAELSKAVQGRL